LLSPFWRARPTSRGSGAPTLDRTGEGSQTFLGDVPFSGALPFTVPQRASDFGDITDYNMSALPYGKTYRYWSYRAVEATPLYPFGFGLSIATISYDSLTLVSTQGSLYCATGAVCVTPKNDSVRATVVVTNRSPHTDGAMPIVLFGSFVLEDGEPSVVRALPTRQLLAHTKVVIPAGTTLNVSLSFAVAELAGALRQAWPGTLTCWVGHGLAHHPGAPVSHVGSPGEGATPIFADLSLVLPMAQVPSDCRHC